MANTEEKYSYIFNLEHEFQHDSVKDWMETNWISVCTLATTVYLPFIFGVRAIMKDRPPFELRRPLAVWSCSLAIFSIAGALRTWTELLQVVARGGLYQAVCTNSFKDRVAGLWTFLFVTSKVLELLDTAFIVLRKQKLIFLHWYHHISVMWMCFYSYSELSASCRVFMVMNYTVHSVMYSYYTLRAMKVRVPRAVAMTITSCQIIQFVLAGLVTGLVLHYQLTGVTCAVSLEQNILTLINSLIYLGLFAWFFYNSYMRPRNNKEELKKD